MSEDSAAQRQPSATAVSGATRAGPAEAPIVRSLQGRAIDLMLDHGLYVALVVLIVVMSVALPVFLTLQNLLNIGQSVAVIGIVAAGLTVALIGGQIDLSVGSTIGLTTVIIALLAGDYGFSLAAAIAVALVASLLVGWLNGFIVVRFGINSIITTLAMLTGVYGISLILSRGQTLPIAEPSFQLMVFARPLGIPVVVVLMLAVYVIAGVFLYGTRVGWHVYAAGGNQQAASRAGVNTSRLFRVVFLQSSVLAAIGGILIAAQTASGSANFGRGTELDVLTAVLIGGIGLGGGAGRVERTLAGVLFIGIIANGLVLMNVESFYQQVIRGVVLILAVVLDATRAKRGAR